MLDNPSLIYEGPDDHNHTLARPRAPLVLLHDGGGTTFSYHLLDPMDRPVWAIYNARLDEGGYWEGGIPQMAAHYIELIGGVLPEGGEILLGGWSLGGMLALEMAWQLANRPPPTTTSKPRFTVIGMIFIDSVYPKRLGELRGNAMPSPSAQPIVKTAEELKAMKLREKVDLNMTHARLMVGRWEMPDWPGREGEVPPTVLLRAKELVVEAEEERKGGSEVGAGVVDKKQEEGERGPVVKKSFVDYTRDFKMLGWDEYSEARGGFIKKVVDIEGHHFSIFKTEHLEDVTNKIIAAAKFLDEPNF
ncbi:Uu.00g141970.m01.CDS01 [Anthostomella pinea]|uniref:Uu.00g141970.m01.CDS01 n=1 Tax=Anthostomella pinea TaxID=933095 RepID=A0AAI8VQG9_9PEZI|nr:Uu.00g141970.m01.CDS01 [Anthostomella pinea]